MWPLVATCRRSSQPILPRFYRGDGSDEYRDPVEFFRRTYLTAGLKDLLVGALQRISGSRGRPGHRATDQLRRRQDPLHARALSTSSERAKGSFSELDELLATANIKAPPKARRIVLGWDRPIPRRRVTKKPDGVIVRTLWGELAWQLGDAAGGKGKEAYQFVADSDAKGHQSGLQGASSICSASTVRSSFSSTSGSPTHGRSSASAICPSGDFEVTDFFRPGTHGGCKGGRRKRWSLHRFPASKIEIGGENGELALDTLKNVFTRVGKPWRPASADEGFEIVRRRLFEPVEGKDAEVAREAVVRAFAKMYKDGADDFPAGVRGEGVRARADQRLPHPSRSCSGACTTTGPPSISFSGHAGCSTPARQGGAPPMGKSGREPDDPAVERPHVRWCSRDPS